MSPKKTPSPAVLAALGLSACVDGCEPSALPVVGRLFEESADVHPCLTFEPTDTGVRTCLSPLPEPIEREPPRVTPCLSRVPTSPPPRVGPCLSRPATPAPPPVNVCLSPMVEPQLRPCLDVIAPDVPDDDGSGSLPGPTEPDPAEDVLRRLIDRRVLPDDVRRRLDEDA